MQRDLRQLQAVADVQTLTELFIQWSEKSNNPQIQEAVKAWAQTTEWIIYLETERSTYDRVLNEALDEKVELRKQLKEKEAIEQRLIQAELMLKKYF
jgi:hypothetical protein